MDQTLDFTADVQQKVYVTYWVVTFYYGRGRVDTVKTKDKSEAYHVIETAVFKNEDCVNCHIHTEMVLEDEDMADTLPF